MAFHPIREQRVAIVLYGGVSLAIYMNGIAQELLRMVRASSPKVADDKLDDVEKVYRRLAERLRTQFVIDIVAGTSAGGINGVALAKALVNGSENLDVLREAWVDRAGIGDLLNDGGMLPGSAPDALLDGRHMYDVLVETLGAMNAEAGAGAPEPLVDVLELYVTATDLRGRKAPIQLTGTKIEEPVHRAVFNFRFDEADGRRGDFGPDSDKMLAFAARCTSSFPVAFAPMRFADIPRAGEVADGYARFFPGGLAAGSGERERQYADGGYLDNRPFSYAIEAIPVMPRSLPGRRTLFFIDPFPDVQPLTDRRGRELPYDFLQNAKLAATTLPRRETIREDIRKITGINRRIDLTRMLFQRRQEDEKRLGLGARAPKPSDLSEAYLDELVPVPGYGESYALYHHLRIYAATDVLTNLVTRLGGFELRSDEWNYLRMLVRAWRETNFSPYRDRSGTPRRSEAEFLSLYDIDFRVRRLNYVRDAIDAEVADQPDAVVTETFRELHRQIARHLGAFRRLVRPGTLGDVGVTVAQMNGLKAALAEKYDTYVKPTSIEGRYEVALAIYEPERGNIDAFMDTIAKNLKAAFDASSDAIRGKPPATAADAYEGFHWYDVATFPFLEGTSAEERSEVQIFRISPADNPLNPNPRKLAGLAVGAFGGFLNQDWREHDIRWGRLDGAARIVAAVMPDAPEPERLAWTEALEAAILADEFGKQPSRRLPLISARLEATHKVTPADILELNAAIGNGNGGESDLRRWFDAYKATTPLGPGGREVATWGSRSASILARMIDDLPDQGFLRFAGNRAATGLRAGGVLSAQVARFAMPGTFNRSIADNVLFLAILAGMLVALLAMFVTNGSPRDGVLIAGIALAIWVTLYLAGRVFRRKMPPWGLVVLLGGAGLLFLAVFGADTLIHRPAAAHPTAIQAEWDQARGWVGQNALRLVGVAAFVCIVGMGVSALTQRRGLLRLCGIALICLALLPLAATGAVTLWDLSGSTKPPAKTPAG